MKKLLKISFYIFCHVWLNFHKIGKPKDKQVYSTYYVVSLKFECLCKYENMLKSVFVK